MSAADADEPLLTIDEAYRATYKFVAQYAARERDPAGVDAFVLMLHAMTLEPGRTRETADPATWDDWIEAVRAARATTER
ncbi:MAG: hypothetical protein ABR946_02700 [Solirubrobacteraceae bacterium]|jgi:hypothetical protein